MTEANVSCDPETLHPGIDGSQVDIWERLQNISDKFNNAKYTFSVSYEAYKKTMQAIDDLEQCHPERFRLIEELMNLEPYLDKELKKRKYGKKTIDKLLDEAELDQYGVPVDDSLLMCAVRAARGAEERAALPEVEYETSYQVIVPMDKLQGKYFNPDARTVYRKKVEESGKRLKAENNVTYYPISYSKERGDVLIVGFDVSNDMEIEEKTGLSAEVGFEDFFVLCFIGDAYLHGNHLITGTKLYTDCYGTKPNQRQLDEFINRLTKLSLKPVFINDKAVRERRHLIEKDDIYVDITDVLAPLKIKAERALINGKVANCTVKIRDYPTILQLGYEIGQITTVPKSLLQVTKKDKQGELKYMRRTERLYKVLFYLVCSLSRIKNNKQTNKILFSTFHTYMNEKDRRGFQHADEMLYVVLDHFKREGWITDYIKETTKSTGEKGLRFRWKKARDKPLPSKK